MKLTRVILREIAHRKLNAALLGLSVAAAVACVLTTTSLLRAHDTQTAAVLDQMHAQTQDRVDLLKDDYRKIALELGFNVFILPKDVPLDQAYLAGLGGNDMPEEYAHRLAQTQDVITINHILPSLSAPVLWAEQGKQIVLTGTRGQLAMAGRGRGVPLVQPVEAGQIVLGCKLAEATGLKVGDTATLLGHDLAVHRIHAARGTQDDITAWIDLPLAQQLLNKPGRITQIHAVNCLAPNCHPDETGIPSVNQEIASVLPDTQVIIDMGKARTRIEARQRAAAEARAALDHETARRDALRAQLANLSDWLNPVAVIGAALWIGLLAMINVRDRRQEIAVFRALGLTTARLLTIFLGKAVALGLLGGAAGIAIATTITLTQADSTAPDAPALLLPLALALLCAPCLAAAATWLPALHATRQDPATILAQE